MHEWQHASLLEYVHAWMFMCTFMCLGVFSMCVHAGLGALARRHVRQGAPPGCPHPSPRPFGGHRRVDIFHPAYPNSLFIPVPDIREQEEVTHWVWSQKSMSAHNTTTVV